MERIKEDFYSLNIVKIKDNNRCGLCSKVRIEY